MKLWKMLRRIVGNKTPEPLTCDDHIVATRKAIARARRRMDVIEEPFDFPAMCCPMCACGPVWNGLADKRERQAWWLTKLLRKRGQPGDLAEIKRLNFDFDFPRRAPR